MSRRHPTPLYEYDTYPDSYIYYIGQVPLALLATDIATRRERRRARGLDDLHWLLHGGEHAVVFLGVAHTARISRAARAARVRGGRLAPC